MHLHLKPLANKLCQPLGVRNKCASIFRMYTVLHTFQLQNSKCIWMEILSPAGTTKVVFFQWLDQNVCWQGILGNPGDVQTACLLFMMLPPKLRPMRTCLKASWPPSSQSGTKKRSRDTSSANGKPWKAAGGLLTLVHRGRVMLVLTVNRLHYLWPTWQLSPIKAWVRKSHMNPTFAIVRGTKHVFGGN